MPDPATMAGAGSDQAELGTALGSSLATPSQARPVRGPLDHIGPYKIVRPLGEGGMGVVYLAEQTEPSRRTVALKVIKLGMDTHASWGASRRSARPWR